MSVCTACLLLILCLASCNWFSTSHLVVSPLLWEDGCLSCCAYGQMAVTHCQKHTTAPHNLCSHKVPEQPLHSGTYPGSPGTSFLPVPSLPHTPCRAWMGKWLMILVFLERPWLFPLVNRRTQTGLVRVGKTRNAYLGFSRWVFRMQANKAGEKTLQRGREKDWNTQESLWRREKWGVTKLTSLHSNRTDYWCHLNSMSLNIILYQE